MTEETVLCTECLQDRAGKPTFEDCVYLAAETVHNEDGTFSCLRHAEHELDRLAAAIVAVCVAKRERVANWLRLAEEGLPDDRKSP